MYYLLNILLVFVCFNINYSQEEIVQKNEINLNQVEISNIRIANIKIGSTKDYLKKEIGNPNSIEELFNDFEGYKFYEYKYENFTFFISDDFVEGFEILGKLNLSIKNKSLNIGDDESVLKEMYPNSYRNKIEEKKKIVLQ